MKAVNDATKITLDRFRKKAEELPWESHPYVEVLECRNKLGVSEWNDEHRKNAVVAITLWTVMILGKSGVAVLNEIVALMRIADESENEEHKKAAQNMNSSMEFIETIFKTFMQSVDVEFIAEQLFEDGLRREKERNEEFAAAEAAKAKVAKQKSPLAKPVSGTIHRRWEPSQN